MTKLFFLLTAVIISVTGCAGFSETSGTSGGAGTSNSFNPASDIYFG